MPDQDLERGEITEPRRLVRGQGLHDTVVLDAVRHHPQRVHVLVDPRHTDLADDRLQTCLHQVLLLDRSADRLDVGVHDIQPDTAP